jgi:hypothetical protein
VGRSRLIRANVIFRRPGDGRFRPGLRGVRLRADHLGDRPRPRASMFPSRFTHALNTSGRALQGPRPVGQTVRPGPA